jgi:phosphopantetheinyl transferase
MEIIDIAHITDWPEEVRLGVSEIMDGHSLDILSSEELEEFKGFKNDKRKAEYLSGRHLFRSLIKDFEGDKLTFKLQKEPSGKPFASYNDENVHVSFSHSPRKVYCAVSKKYDIGLDVEHTERKINDAVVKRILNKEEWETVRFEDPVRLWTIKEAAVKCLGTGLRTNLEDLTIQKNKKNRFSVRFSDDKLFEICSFRVTDHQIALAYQSQHN